MTSIHVLKKKQRAFYKSITPIYCPILKDTVHFTSEGFNHLLYKSHSRPRNINEQYLKLKCLTYAPTVIKKCIQIIEIRKVQKKINNKWKNVFHYELIYKISKGDRIQVIVEKIGSGKYKFLSVMRCGKGIKLKSTPKGAS